MPQRWRLVLLQKGGELGRSDGKVSVRPAVRLNRLGLEENKGG